MYKPLFQDSIIAVSIAVRCTILPKLIIGDATFYYIRQGFWRNNDLFHGIIMGKWPFFQNIGLFGPFLAILVNSIYLEYWSIGIFYPLHYFLYNDFQSLTFRHKTDILYKNLHLLTKFTLNGGHFEYLDFSN